MDGFYYRHQGYFLASQRSNLPFSSVREAPPEAPLTWLFEREPSAGRCSFCPSDLRQLTAPEEDVRFLDPRRLSSASPEGAALRRRLEAGTLRAVNRLHPRWEEALTAPPLTGRKVRVHLLAVGDVGGALLTALKLLGGECIDSIGICDLDERTVERWVAEMGQISRPWDYGALPTVEAVAPERLFECDVFLFAAARAIPPVGSTVRDVRMAQLSANRPLAEKFARQARDADFRGQFIVLSDPVDPLCRAVFLASNQGEDGQWDGLGLLPEQIRGFGLGVMNARAADIAQKAPEFSSFLTEGRSFGPHGEGLVIANSVERYDDALSDALTRQVLEANLRIRALGFKPYVAPAVSSGALQLILSLQGQWHCASVPLGQVWFGCRCRITAAGLETEALALPDALFERLRRTEALLRSVL